MARSGRSGRIIGIRVGWILGVLVGIANPVPAQGHLDTVREAKTFLEMQGANLSGSCGAWQISNLTAWRLRDEGAGILQKPAGNNCRGYAVDVVVYKNGQAYDVLISAGEQNGPSWNDIGVLDPARWHAPIPVEDGGGPPDPDDPPPPPPSSPPDPLPVLEEIRVGVDVLRLTADRIKVAVDRMLEEQDRLLALEQDTNTTLKEQNGRAIDAFVGISKWSLKYALPAILAWIVSGNLADSGASSGPQPGPAAQ